VHVKRVGTFCVCFCIVGVPSEKTQNPVCMRVCIVRVTAKKDGMLCVYVSSVTVTQDSECYE